MYLPLEPILSPEADFPLEPLTAPALEGLEVLLVEDEAMAREATQRLLEQGGAQVRAVHSAAAAREAWEARRPDILLADIGMPDEDGYDLIRSLRDREQAKGSPRVPAIALTAFARSEDRERALAAGFDEHLPKPVNPERLIALINELRRPKY